ncbi:MAG: hypothetical protein PHX16_03605 [Syntrophaceticus sp.]|jgi:hypothetical protein|nr:hypothetical protein [Syntrophaceticus sp.]MDD4360554.1 hypothetical protein [Syntrophaceticus sp.]MDD4782719.1 hypothetical protein [Syntrophaceticus sp.]
MAHKDKRRLEIWLPVDHPVFSYPSGVRATIAREWLNIGSLLLGMDKNIKDIKERINKIEIKSDNSQTSEEEEIGFDPREFADNIEKLFG